MRCIQLDSLLGATLQRTQYSETRKRVLIDTVAPPKEEDPAEIVKIVSGVDVLTNNEVRE